MADTLRERIDRNRSIEVQRDTAKALHRIADALEAQYEAWKKKDEEITPEEIINITENHVLGRATKHLNEAGFKVIRK